MRHSATLTLLAMCVFMLLAGMLMGQEAAPTTPKLAAEAKTLEDKVVIKEDVLVVFMDEPEHHFDRAKEHFLKKEYEAAAKEIRKSAGFLKLQAARANGETKKALQASAEELEKLAGDVEKGTVRTVDKLEKPFAAALHALAQHHHQKASESWMKRAEKKTGHDLKAAAHHVEHAARWSGEQLEEGGKLAVRDARLVSGKLVEGAGWSVEEVGKAVEGIGSAVKWVGKKVEPKKKEAPAK
jgi:hypothetical protein